MTNNKSYGTGGIGFIDGEYMPFSELRIPVTDMGFQLADMCYDAVHVWKGRFFRLDDHLARFQTGLQKRRYDTLSYDIEAIADVCNGCVARLGVRRILETFSICIRVYSSGLQK